LDEQEGLIPLGAEWWSDKEWARRSIWEGQMFRMGWWGEEGKEGFRIDVRPQGEVVS
jgi:hypothetical protein